MNNSEDVLFYKIIRPIVKCFVYIFLHPKIIGKENINKGGRILLAGNHTNNLDCLLLMSSTKREIHFLAKNELWKGFKKIIFSNLGLIPVNRKEKDHNCILKAEDYLNNNKLVGIFPEGTTEKENNKLLPFKIGAVKVAKDTNTKIVPFAITGCYKVLSNNLTIRFGKPFLVRSDNLENENNNLKTKVEELMVGDK